MEKRRLIGIIGGACLTIICGGINIDWLNENCSNLPQNDCRLMWGVASAAILGGVFLAEFLYSRKRKLFEHQNPPRNISKDKSDSPNWYIWVRPIAWVTLSSLLASMSLIVQGAFILVFFGIIAGMFLDILIRAALNKLPPDDEEYERLSQ